MSAPLVQRIGDDRVGLHVDSPQRAQLIAAYLRGRPYLTEVVAGMDSVVIAFDPLNLGVEAVEAALVQAASLDQAGESAKQTTLDIAVTYGGAEGPDFDLICDQTGLSADALIARHTAPLYRVDMIGFTPGFAYCGALDPDLAVARLAHPRIRIPAGSIGLSATHTGIYALDGPGGWPIIGQTKNTLFDAGSEAPFKILPGMDLRFHPA